MPNYTWNTIKADKEILKQLVNEKGCLDFNKFIPMPKALKRTIAGGMINECVCYYLYTTHTRAEAERLIDKSNCFDYGVTSKRNTKEENIKALLKRIGDNPVMFDDERHYENRDGSTYVVKEDYGHTPAEIGKFYWELYEKYGFFNWYDWANKNWGTKWNAFECWGKPEDGAIGFTTAWCMPEPIFERICSMYPNDEIKISAEYEDNLYLDGSNHGGRFIVDDEYEKNYPDDLNDCDYENIPWMSINHPGKELAV